MIDNTDKSEKTNDKVRDFSTNHFYDEENDDSWVCFIFVGIVAVVLVVGLIGCAGPWYHDCDNNDCTTQRNWGMYCDENCIAGNYGPGSGLVLLMFIAVSAILAIPCFCTNRWGGRRKRRQTITLNGKRFVAI